MKGSRGSQKPHQPTRKISIVLGMRKGQKRL